MEQIRLIRREIKALELRCVHCDINTVDRFQGKEKEIVIVSLVRNVMAGRRINSEHVTAYQRINVAVSRAQKLLLLVGAKDLFIEREVELEDMETGCKLPPRKVYKMIADMLNARGCFLTADDILSPTNLAAVFQYTQGRNRP